MRQIDWEPQKAYRGSITRAHCSPVAPATGLRRCFQNEQARNIIRVAITAAEDLFELLGFGQLLQKILVDGGSEGGVEAHVAWG